MNWGLPLANFVINYSSIFVVSTDDYNPNLNYLLNHKFPCSAGTHKYEWTSYIRLFHRKMGYKFVRTFRAFSELSPYKQNHSPNSAAPHDCTKVTHFASAAWNTPPTYKCQMVDQQFSQDNLKVHNQCVLIGMKSPRSPGKSAEVTV